MIPFLAALAVMGMLTVVHEQKPKQADCADSVVSIPIPLADCADSVFVVVYRHVVEGPFPMAEDDSIHIYQPGYRP